MPGRRRAGALELERIIIDLELERELFMPGGTFFPEFEGTALHAARRTEMAAQADHVMNLL